MLRRRKFQAKPNISLSLSSSQHHQSPKNHASPADYSSLNDSNLPTPQNGKISTFEANISFERPNSNFLSVTQPSHVDILNVNQLDQNPTVSSGSAYEWESYEDLVQPLTSDKVPPVSDQIYQDLNLTSPKEKICGMIHEQMVESVSNEEYEDHFKPKKLIEIKREKIFKTSPKELKKSSNELDATTFTMSDLIYWKPKTSNTLRKKIILKKKQLRESPAMCQNDTPKSSTVETDTISPRVKINENGEMVIDEDSLVIRGNVEANNFETVNDELIPKKLNSMSFRKALRSTAWSIPETDLFYDVLAATGTDFGLMHEFIPTRTRAELKKKFNKEEKTSLKRINEVLRRPAYLDEKFKLRISKALEEIHGGGSNDDA